MMMTKHRQFMTSFTSILSMGALVVAIILAYCSPLSAGMTEVSEEALSAVSAQAGIFLNIGDSQCRITADSIKYSDTDHDPHNWVEFNEFAISGPGGYFSLDCPQDYPIAFDVGTIRTIDNQERTLIEMRLSEHVNPRTWEVGNFVFVNQDLGSILMDTCTVDPSYYRVSSHLDGTQGVEWEYLTKWRTEDFIYSYNSTGGSLHVKGINIAERASGALDDPSNPATWEFSGLFRIGDIYGGQIDLDNDPANAAAPNPASFDVATADGKTSLYMNLPMKGTLRAEGVSLGGSNFGPVAIDGITAHHIYVRFDPGN